MSWWWLLDGARGRSKSCGGATRMSAGDPCANTQRGAFYTMTLCSIHNNGPSVSIRRFLLGILFDVSTKLVCALS